MANTNILYLGNTPLIDLSGYATTNYVDTAVSNVDVTQQLNDYLTIVDASINFVAKESGKVLSSNDFTDALKTKLDSLENFDPSDISTALSTIQSTLADITTDGNVQSVIDTFAEIKSFLADYDNTDTLQSIINATSSSIETWVGQQGFLKSNDVSTFITAADLPTVPTNVSAFTNDANYQTANDVSTKVGSANQSVLNIVSISQADYTALATKDASTLYIVI